jgi:hypothetical protein
MGTVEGCGSSNVTKDINDKHTCLVQIVVQRLERVVKFIVSMPGSNDTGASVNEAGLKGDLQQHRWIGVVAQ